MTDRELLLCLGVGGVAGWWAGAVFRSRGYGLLPDLLIGMGGAALAGVLVTGLRMPLSGGAWTLGWALLGASGPLYLVRRLRDLRAPAAPKGSQLVAPIVVEGPLIPSSERRIMALDTLTDLLIEQLQDIHAAEQHLLTALPRMARAATDPQLSRTFSDHLEETREHVARLERMFRMLGLPVRGRACPAIEGLVQEAAQMVAEEGSDPVRDAGLIACAQRVEHYEIAAYGSLRIIAEALGLVDIVGHLDRTLSEEYAAADRLTDITAGSVLPAALALVDPEGGPVDMPPTAATRPAHRGRRFGRGVRR